MKKSLRGKKILITVGPTHEPLDPVRYFTNASSGIMGTEIIKVLKKCGAQVEVVAGPIHKNRLGAVKIFPVKTALQMSHAVKSRLPRADAFIATAAVSDYRPKTAAKQKIKKNKRMLLVQLVKNPDILAQAGQWKEQNKKSITLIGFALETKNIKSETRKKITAKKADLMIGNTPHSFGSQYIKPYWLDSKEGGQSLPKITKAQLAKRVAQYLIGQFKNKKNIPPLRSRGGTENPALLKRGRDCRI